MSQAPKQCPGLSITPEGVTWVDSLNRAHNLERERLLSTGEVATEMKRSVDWVLRAIRDGELYPVLHHNPRNIEVYGCAIRDYYARKLTKGAAA